MPEVALSTIPAPLAALLSGGSADSPAANTPQGSDPFAALLANATAIKTADTAVETKAAGIKAADSVALLLAGAAPVAPVTPAPVIATPNMVAAKAAAAAAPAVATDALPIETEATTALSKGKIKAKAGQDDPDTDSDQKNDSSDPLADAIASGATAVLAFGPAFVAPVPPQAQDATPIQTQVRIDAPIAAKPLKLAPASEDLAHARQAAADTQGQVQALAQADQAVATQDQRNSDGAQADAQARQQTQLGPASDAKPEAAQLSPEVAKAVIAALTQGDTNSTASAPADAASRPTMADAARIQLQQQPQQAPQAPVQAAQPQAAPVQPSQTRRRGEDVVAPRRAGDTRKRADSAPTDAVSAGLPQRGADAAQPTIARPVTDIRAKGDTIVEQTLTIARDGAWLDKLAHDIAGAGSGDDLHFKLEPQNLGALSVAIRHSDDGASIRLTADNQTTRDILVDAQPKLVAEARAQGLKVSDTQIDVRQDQNHSQNQDAQRWAQNQAGQNGTSQNGQNRQSSPGHQPFVSNLARKAEADSESPDRDSGARYA